MSKPSAMLGRGKAKLAVAAHPMLIISTTSSHTRTTTSGNFFDDLMNQIPLPRWAIYVIVAVGILLILLCCLCICIKCCCKGKKKKKFQRDEQINLKGVDGKTSTVLVQPDVVDVDYGSTKVYRGKLLYSLEYNAALSEWTLSL